MEIPEGYELVLMHGGDEFTRRTIGGMDSAISENATSILGWIVEEVDREEEASKGD